MKLRILGNSLRIRLSQSEVRQLETQGSVNELVEFGAGSQILTYSLAANPDLVNPNASFNDHKVLIELPQGWIAGWEKDDRVGFNEELQIQEGKTLKLTVEKDFKCLTVRPGEDESDNFPNPLEAQGH